MLPMAQGAVDEVHHVEVGGPGGRWQAGARKLGLDQAEVVARAVIGDQDVGPGELRGDSGPMAREGPLAPDLRVGDVVDGGRGGGDGDPRVDELVEDDLDPRSGDDGDQPGLDDTGFGRVGAGGLQVKSGPSHGGRVAGRRSGVVGGLPYASSSGTGPRPLPEALTARRAKTWRQANPASR
jgi:hypothetical protein